MIHGTFQVVALRGVVTEEFMIHGGEWEGGGSPGGTPMRPHTHTHTASREAGWWKLEYGFAVVWATTGDG